MQNLLIAQSRSPLTLEQWFSRQDNDKDNFLSQSELEMECYRRFDRADANQNGSLDIKEFTADINPNQNSLIYQRQQRFLTQDLDQDKKVNRTECIKFHKRVIDQCDQNSDQLITLNEIIECKKKD
ncbi:MAG: hypothetical protein K1X44_08480 [Alphaproteobacteria bacterium]|nr:hypothetical protein [Alphaproteobacteria bacterium]